MSQLVLDDQLDAQVVRPVLEKWITVSRLRELRPGEHVLDDRVPAILRTLKMPTFVTIDHDFWSRRLCHSGYCILYFELATGEQRSLPDLLRRMFRLPEFGTRSLRMGKVARVNEDQVTYWEARKRKTVELP